MSKKISFEITSAALHILAMVLMLCDHLWGTIVPGNDWLTCVGRLAYPIFAFMIVEGYFHTKNLKYDWICPTFLTIWFYCNPERTRLMMYR